MTGSEPPPDGREWWRHGNDRWVVGDAGRQADVVAVPAAGSVSVRPDTIVDGGRVGALTYRATSQRGLDHQQSATPRQDAYVVRPTKDGQWLLGCVADGVSEGRHSHRAADLVCRELVAMLADALSALPAGDPLDNWDETAAALPWQRAVDTASAAVVGLAQQVVHTAYEKRGDAEAAARLVEEPLTDAQARKVMASTAVAFAVSTRADSDGGYPAVVTVAAGDSSALLLSDGAWTPLTPVKNTDSGIASSAVAALPRTVEVRPAVHRLRCGQVLVAVTDGLGEPLGTGSGMVGRFLATMWSSPPDLLAFAQHAGFYRRTFTDDRTAVAIWAAPDQG